MKYGKRLLLLLLLCCVLPLRSYAAGPVEPAHPASLTVTAICQEQPVSGLHFDAYRIASVAESGALTPLAAFAAYADVLNAPDETDWQELADTLERAILLDESIRPSRSAVTDSSGVARFPELPLGLYLLRSQTVGQSEGSYRTLPFFVLLPEQDTAGNSWIYDVLAQAKPEWQPALGELTVLKLWEDSCHPQQRPASITVQLLCDGKPYGAPVTLPENGRWQHTWTDLPQDHYWTVSEAAVEGYQSSLRREGNRWILTNTCDLPGEPPEPGLPQTGQLWWPVPLLLCGGLTLLVVGLLRRRGTK